MAKNEILSEIKKAEENAKMIVDDAATNKNESITSARAEAREIIKQADVDAHESAQKALKSAEVTIKADKAKIISDSDVDAKSIIDKAQANTDKAVETLVSEFERAVHA